MTLAKTLLLTALLTFTASSAFAVGGASADCDGDGSNDVSCSGQICQATDGLGCACSDADGNLTEVKSCRNVGFAPPERSAAMTWNDEIPPFAARFFLLEPADAELTEPVAEGFVKEAA